MAAKNEQRDEIERTTNALRAFMSDMHAKEQQVDKKYEEFLQESMLNHRVSSEREKADSQK